MTNSQDVAATTSTSIHAHHGEAQPALVLVNLGTPTAPEPGPVRAFLREFLSDRRVIEMSPLLWKPILEGIILRVRPREVAAKYRSIWMEEGRPHALHPRAGRRLSERLPGVRVEVAMRYGQPSIGSVLDRLHAEGVRRVAILPAYPQYAASTVTTTNDAVARWIGRNRDGFELRLHRSFPAAPAYIEAACDRPRALLGARGPPELPDGGPRRRVLPLDPGRHGRGRGPLPRRVPPHGRRPRVAPRPGNGFPDGHLPVCVWACAVARPADDRGMAELGAASARAWRHLPGLHGGLPGDARGDRSAEPRDFRRGRGAADFHYVPWANDSDGAVAALEEQSRIALAGWV